MRQLLIHLLHSLNVESTALCVLDHGFGIVHAHHTVGCLLHGLRGIPGLIDVAVGVVFQDGDVAPSKEENKVTLVVQVNVADNEEEEGLEWKTYRM